MADNPTKKASAFPLVTASSAADSIPIIRAGVTSRIHPASGGGLDADTVDGYQAATLYIPRGYIDGLICSNAADAEHDITIAPGVARDSTNDIPLILASAITKRIDAAWAAGTNAGGMLPGSALVANSVYYLRLIRKDSDGSIDCGFWQAGVALGLPVGYTYSRRIMSVCTDAAANIIGFTQVGDYVYLKEPIANRAQVALAATSKQSNAVTAPPNAIVMLAIEAYLNSTSAAHYLWYGDASRADAAASATKFDLFLYPMASPNSHRAEILTDASRLIYFRGTTTDIYVSIHTYGWIDDRGRNA